ncbi:MAG: DUF3137 domain-containing protein [Novosphingobium sp.]|nr:DUF3137 domain-containing protein [Novosphingobium sp.]
MIERPDAAALMAGPLGQWLTAQNADRDAAKAKAAAITRTALIAAVAVAFVLVLMTGRPGPGLQIGFFIGAGGFAWAEWSKRPVLNRLKGGINGAIAKALGLDYSVECQPGKTFERAKQFDMVPGYDDSTFHDLWWGLVAGQPFTLHEARLTEQRGSGKNRHTVTVFEGQILSIGFNRRFHSTTLIEPDGERRKFLIGAEKETVGIGGLDLGRVDITHPGFEERFTVWSSDQVEARYIVHPEYVERLLAVEEAFAGEDIRALFHEGDLLITVKTGNLFESGSLDARDDRALLERAIDQFGALTDLATTLNERARASFS